MLVQESKKCRHAHFFVVAAPERHVLFGFSAKHDNAAVDKLLGGYEGITVLDAHVVYDHLFLDGKIKEADKRAQSIVLDGEKAQMFLITSETRLSKEGKPATFDELTAGETVGGRAQEKDGKWEAVAINIGKPPVKATKTKQLEEKPEAK